MRAKRVMILGFGIMFAASMVIGTGCGDGDTGPTETRDSSFTVGEFPKLIVSNENGSVEIVTGNDEEVQIQAELVGIDKIDYDVRQDKDTILVDVDIEGSYTGDVRAYLTITTPKLTEAIIENSNGHIEVYGIEREANLKTSNGKILLKNSEGQFKLRSSNGALEMQNVEGEFDAETSNGNISFKGEMIPLGDNRMVTSNGAVEIELENNPSIALEAKTSNGSIDSELPVLATTTKSEHLLGTIGDGQAELYVRTSNGNIRIS